MASPIPNSGARWNAAVNDRNRACNTKPPCHSPSRFGRIHSTTESLDRRPISGLQTRRDAGGHARHAFAASTERAGLTREALSALTRFPVASFDDRKPLRERPGYLEEGVKSDDRRAITTRWQPLAGRVRLHQSRIAIVRSYRVPLIGVAIRPTKASPRRADGETTSKPPLGDSGGGGNEHRKRDYFFFFFFFFFFFSPDVRARRFGANRSRLGANSRRSP